MFRHTTTNEELVSRLTERMLACVVGDIVTHVEMREIAGDKPWLHQQARKRANRQAGAIFRAVKGIGLERLPSGEAHAVGQTALHRIRRTANNTSDTIAHAVTKSNSVSDQDTIRAYATMNVLGLIGRQTYKQNVDAREAEIRSSHSSSTEAARASLEAMRTALGRRK